MINKIQLEYAGKIRVVVVSYKDTATQKVFALEDISNQLIGEPGSNVPSINYVAAAILDALAKTDLYDGVSVELYQG